jgi:hypothetical protein
MQTYEQEREEALYSESQPYCAFRTADEERHYLYVAGFRDYCDCTGCELQADYEAEARYELDCYQADLEAMTPEQLDAEAARLFEDSASRAAQEFDPAATFDPWA